MKEEKTKDDTNLKIENTTGEVEQSDDITNFDDKRLANFKTVREWISGKFSWYSELEDIKNFFIKDLFGKELEVSLEGSHEELYSELEGKIIKIKYGLI